MPVEDGGNRADHDLADGIAAETLCLISALEHRGLDTWAAEVCDAWLKRAGATKTAPKLALHRAHLALRLADPKGALKLAQQAGDATESTLVLQGDATHRLGKISQAVATWRRVLELNPLRDDVVARIQRARASAERFGKPLELQRAVELVKPTVVVITGTTGCGSGFFLTPDGLLLTNLHVIVGVLEPKATAIFIEDGKETRETFPIVGVVAANARLDLAVVRVMPRGRRFRPLRLAQGDIPKLALKLFVVGSPLGLDYTITQGIVSSALRKLPNGVWAVQTDATFEPGVSGGAVCNYRGEAIGVAAAVAGKIGFFIPATVVRDFLKTESIDPMATLAPSPRRLPRRLPRRTTSKPPDAGAVRERLAKKQLKLARLYAANKMIDQAISQLESLIKKYPKTAAAKEARQELEKLK